VHEKHSVLVDLPPTAMENPPRTRDVQLDWQLWKLKTWIASVEDRSRGSDQIAWNLRPYLLAQWHGRDSACRDDQFASAQDGQAKTTARRP